MSVDTRVSIGSATLPNPVGVASGTFGFGSEYAALVDTSSLGAIFTKAVTSAPRAGNPAPRLVETPSGMLNSIGLANPGLEAFARDRLPSLPSLGCPVFVNVAGASEEEYAAVVRGIEAAAGDRGIGEALAGYEINLSCPNVRHGGLAFGTDPAQVERVTAALRPLTDRALIVKLTPNVSDIGVIARAAENGGADAVSCINTLVGMVIDTRALRSAIPAGTAGLSGPAIRPVGVACVWKASRAISIPVIGLGGIACADDALQYLLAGAVAVQLGTGLFVDPDLPAGVLRGIAEFMEGRKLSRVEDIRTLMR